MRLKIKPDWKEKASKWHKWFAWYPVKIEDEWIWRENIERRLHIGGGESNDYWGYRL